MKKRFISHLLSLSLVILLLPITATAAFIDDSSIQHKEAVNKLTSDGIITGFEDGSFKPNETLTRSQACAILARKDLGAVKNLAGVTSFKDVTMNYWGMGYIAYCVNKGYVAGYGNGNFGPEDQLTGTQWSKMVLTTMGYDAQREGMVGSQWAKATTDLAVKAKLYNDLPNFNGSAPISRDNACQILFNGISNSNNSPSVQSYPSSQPQTSPPAVDNSNQQSSTAYVAKAQEAIDELYSRLKNPQSLQIHSVTVYSYTAVNGDLKTPVEVEYSAMNGFGGYNRAYYHFFNKGSFVNESSDYQISQPLRKNNLDFKTESIDLSLLKIPG